LKGATSLWLIAVALLFSGLFMSSLLNGDFTRGSVVISQYVFSYLILLIIIVREEFDVTLWIAAAFVAGILVVDIHGIITFYTVGYVPGEVKGAVTGSNRLATLMRNPNLAAAMNALTTPILLYVWSTGRLRALFALPILAIFFITVIHTGSNSGLLVMTACLCIFTAFIVTPRLLLRLLFGGGVIALVSLTAGGAELLPETFRARVLGAIYSGDLSEAGTFISRTELMKEAITVISEKSILLLGMGADRFREVSVQSAPVHNVYLLLWVEGGLLALFGWLLFAVVGTQIWLALFKGGASKQILATVASTVSVFLLIAISNPHMYARFWTIPLLLAYGLGIAHLRQLSHSKATRL
jgi:O-antigen ligase